MNIFFLTVLIYFILDKIWNLILYLEIGCPADCHYCNKKTCPFEYKLF